MDHFLLSFHTHQSNSEMSEVLLPQIKVEAGPSHCSEMQECSSDLEESTRESSKKKCTIYTVLNVYISVYRGHNK